MTRRPPPGGISRTFGVTIQHEHVQCTQQKEKLMLGLSQIHRRLVLAAGAVLVPIVLASAPADAAGTPARVRGSVVSLEGSKLVVHSAKDGKDVAVTLNDNFAVLAVVKSSMAEIKQGSFIGTATVTQPDSSLRSQEVVVFPEN
jgi:hypothetical protein